MKPVDFLSVDYLGEPFGQLVKYSDGNGTLFYYDEDFLDKGLELSPLHLPTTGPVPHLKDSDTTKQLPGVIYDSLPDSFGIRTIRQWFAKNQYPDPDHMTMLAFLGDDSFGALTYRPSYQLDADPGQVDLFDLNQTTKDIGSDFSKEINQAHIPMLSSAGGAQRKATVSLCPETGKAMGGTGAGIAYLIKFPDASRMSHPRIEHAYAGLAARCGIRVQKTRLVEMSDGETGEACFAAERFDRDPDNHRVHYHSFKGICEGRFDTYRHADYVDLAKVTFRLTRSFQEVKEVYRRALFNVLVDNTDDHFKNHGFLFRDTGWELSPAFDLTYRGTSGAGERGTRVCGIASMMSRELFKRFADEIDLDPKSARSIEAEVLEGLEAWPEVARRAGVSEGQIELIALSHQNLIRVFTS